MGWSCRTEAMQTMRAIERVMEKKGSTFSNELITPTWRGMYEYSRREHADGAITGTVFRNVGKGYVRKVGSFRINPDGDIARFPGISLQEQAYIHTQAEWYLGSYDNPHH